MNVIISIWLGREDYSARPAPRPGGASRKAPLFKIAPGDFVEPLFGSPPPVLAVACYSRSILNVPYFNMAGPGGFEPPHDGIKTRCLTAWRRPNKLFIHTLLVACAVVRHSHLLQRSFASVVAIQPVLVGRLLHC